MARALVLAIDVGTSSLRTALFDHRAGLLTDTDRYAAAEPFYLEALDIARQRLGETHLETVNIREDLAALYTAWGRPDEAARYQ